MLLIIKNVPTFSSDKDAFILTLKNLNYNKKQAEEIKIKWIDEKDKKAKSDAVDELMESLISSNQESDDE